jgi:hypothetical protein
MTRKDKKAMRTGAGITCNDFSVSLEPPCFASNFGDPPMCRGLRNWKDEVFITCKQCKIYEGQRKEEI